MPPPLGWFRQSIAERARLSRTLLLAALLAGPGGPPASVSAQSDEPPVEEFQETLDVHLITIQVTAETATGRPVTDLRRDDFRIREDGEPRELALFLPPVRAVRDPAASPEPPLGQELIAAPVGEESPYAVPGVVEDAVAQADQRIVLGFDFYSMSQRHLKRAVAHCIRLLEGTDEEDGIDRVWAVVVLGAEPWMVLPYTNDRRLVAGSLDQVVQFGAGEAFQAWGRGSFLARDKKLEDQKQHASAVGIDDDVERAARSADARQAQLRNSEQFTGDLSARLQATALTASTSSVTDLFRSLGTGDADRALVYFFRGGDEGSVELPEGTGSETTADRLLVKEGVMRAWQEVAEVGASAGFRVFSVDVNGLSLDAGYRGLNTETGFAPYFDESRAAGFQELFPEDVAITLATGTGGRMIESNNFAAGIEAAQDAAGNTYVLGYQVDRPRDGQRHRVSVSLAGRPGVLLRYAPSFVDLPPRQRLLEALNTSANLPKRQGRLPLEFQGKVTRSDAGFRLEVEASLPVGRLGLVRRDERLEGDVEMFLAVYDAAGKLLVLESKRSALVAAADSRAVIWRRAVDLATEPRTVAVALLDHVEERYAVASARLGS